jgi:uncharacterized membrane protein
MTATAGFLALLFGVIGAISITVLFKLNAAWDLLSKSISEGYGDTRIFEQSKQFAKLHFPIVMVIAFSFIGAFTALAVFIGATTV